MEITENYGVISGFLNSATISQYDECSCADHCDCHCTDPDDD